MMFFPLFLGCSLQNDLKLKPSVYLREMMLSTDQRIEQLNKLTLKKTRTSFLYDVDDQKDFKISPPIVLFQSFQPGKQYGATLTICNISEGSKLVGIKSKPAHTFCVSYLSKVTSKLAPGISLHFLIKFMPLSDQDYSDSLVLEADRYTFEIPLTALGSRPLVNFPDFVDLKETLVKIPSKRIFYIKNIGQVPATFNMTCEEPFSVSPERCILEVEKIAMITIHFETDILDDFFKKMFVRFETGEELCIDLSGSTKNGKVWLDSKRVYVDDTFMGLKRQQKVTLYNDTDVTITYSWHQFETRQQDLAEFERVKEGFEHVKLDETIRCTKLEYNDIITEDNHANVYSRILKDQVEQLSPKDLYFCHTNFEINPVEGELWPGGRSVVSVTFSPHTVGQFSCTAYCDVAGVAHRLPLQMCGRGLGPLVHLNLRSLDIDAIFLGLTQAYEIVAANKGDILCRLEHVPSQTVFGGTLTVQPPFQCLMPYEMKSFIISFCSGQTGSFVEDVFFKITQSNEVLKIMLKGNVVNPTISFDCAKLDFGCVAVGYPKTMSVGLVNQSQVPVEFALRVPSDGRDPPITFQHFSAISPKPSLVSCCNEFTISPDSGVIDPNTTLPIEVTLLTNANRKHSCMMAAENKNSKLLESISLSLIYEARVATLICNPPELILRFSFINYEYKLNFTLTNSSTLPAYFYFPPQNQILANCILYTMDVSEALLEPNESVTMTVAVVPIVTGRVKQDIMVLLFGNSMPTPLCSISCSVQGPNVSSNVVSLEYGKMILMEPKTLTFELSNDSPISSFFMITIEERAQSKWTVEPVSGTLGPGESVTVSVTLQVLDPGTSKSQHPEERAQSKWTVEPVSGTLGPGESVTVSVTLQVLDPGTISTSLSIQVENSRVISVGLFASASGCGITIEPNIFPEIDLGYLFSRRLHQIILTFSNPGSRHHFITFVQDRMSLNSGQTMHPSLFKLNPNKFDLVGGGKAQVILEGQSNRDVEVVESYHCQAIINKRGVKQSLGNFLIKANFISPTVEVSDETLEFEINIGPKDKQGETFTKSLNIKSIANLPVTMLLELNLPFFILENGDRFCESVIELKPYQETEIILGFNPPLQHDLESVVYNENLLINYKEHPQKDKIPLKGMLNFPNLDLSQHTLDFECIPLDCQEYRQIYMVNPTPLPVQFSFSLDPNSIIAVYFEHENIEEMFETELPEALKENPLLHNNLLRNMANKESALGPIPLVFVEPVASSVTQAVEKQEDESLTEEEMQEIHRMLFPVIQPYFTPEYPTPEFNILPNSPASKPDVSQVFDLTPVFGIVPPYKTQVLNVAFRPHQFMGVAATAVCTIAGGPTETIRLSGQSARHIFSVSTTFINFGFRIFMEPCEEVIKITNMSQLPFTFTVSSALSPPMTAEVYDVRVGCLTVEPCFGHVPAHGSAVITVKFYPGLAGEFQQQFTIQVGYLEPVNVLVTGYGVVPQVTMNCPHVSRPKTPIHWGYQAIASVTAKRFPFLDYASSMDFEAPDDPELEDWSVVPCLDKLKVPMMPDFWLAHERVIAYNYIKENSQYLFKTGESSKKLFYQCLLPGYLLDLGSVVLGTTTNVTVLVENRGFVRCDLKLVLPMPEKKLKQLGFFVSFQNHIGLPVGKSVPLDITIKPTTQKYSSKEEAVHFTFYLQVVSGPTVPLYFKALFTVPYIVVDYSIMDFGSVQCGHCKKMCLILKNSGAVKAEWNVSLVVIKRKKQGKVLPEELVRFSVNKTSGLFPPKTGELLEIGFLPKEERFYETTLKLEVKHNPEVVTVRLCGFGVEPKVTVSPKTVQFGTHVPFSGPIETRFSITNPCPFNVQVYFPDFDREIMNEDRILRVLTSYYKSDTMLLPLETYDKVPSSELEGFYDQIKNEVSMALRSMELKTKNVDPDAVSLSASNDIPYRKTSRRSTKISVSKLSLKSHYNHLDSLPDPFASLDPAETERRLLEHLNDPENTLQLPKDPLGLEARCTLRVLDETRDINKGILNVFHGAPHCDSAYWANRTGKRLNHKVVTLDELVLREVATSDKPAAVLLQEAINSAYMEQALDEESMDRLTDSGSGVSFGELCERVNFLKSAKESALVPEEDKKKSGDKKASASKPGTAKKVEAIKTPPATFHDIPVETYIELLRDRLLEEVEKGLVLESLTGFFLKTISSSVTVILTCVGHISCLRFISLFGTLEMLEEKKRKSLEDRERLRIAVEEDKILALNHMTSDQLEQVPLSEKMLYEDFVVEERRQWYKELIAKREEARVKSLTASPETTVKSKGGDKKGKKSNAVSVATKKSKKTDKTKISQVDKLNKSENASSQAKKKGVKRTIDIGAPGSDLGLKEAFDKYEMELQELVFLLSRWNKVKCQFEGLDRPSSLYNVKTQGRPQSKKSKDARRKSSDIPGRIGDDSVGVKCVIVIRQTLVIKPDDAITFLRAQSNFRESENILREWWDLKLPEPLILSSVCKPELRAQNDKQMAPFNIFDFKKGSHDESVLETVQSATEQPIEVLKTSQEHTGNLEEEFSALSRSRGSHSQKTEQITSLSSSFRKDESIAKEEITLQNDFDQNISKKSSVTLEEIVGSSDEKVFTCRVELAPGEKRSWSVFFEPERLGYFNLPLQLEVAGWKKKYQLVIEGFCDIPHIDTNPASMFEKVQDSLSPTFISQCVFLNDTKLFYFGPVFATDANEFRTNDLTTNFYFTNVSAVDVDVEFAFMTNTSSGGDPAFGFKPSQMFILPGETKALEVFACPTVVGKYTDTLVYSIFDNAMPGFIEVSCIGVKPDFEFEPKEIRFERVLLYRKEFSELTLANKCYKPLGWRLVDLPLLSKQVSVSQQSGVIPAMQSTSVYINFSASYVEVANHIIYIEVFDDQFRGRPFFSEPIPVILESVDVLVDVMFPPGSEDSELKFKSVKVGEPETQTVVLKNIGKYDVTFSIKFNEDLKLNFRPEQVFTFTPKSGTLPKMEKSLPVKITCMCTKPVCLKKVTVFKILLVDTGPGAQPVAAIPINVTIDVFTSRYRVIPESELNFSSMLVGTKKVEHILIENIGKFEFIFQILTLEQLKMEKLEHSQQTVIAVPARSSKSKAVPGSTRSSLKTGKDKPNAKGKEKKEGSRSSLTIGAFTLSHSEGTVLPGESFKIDVECYVPMQDTYFEEIVIKIMEYDWIKKEGTRIKLKAVSYLPFINFENVHNIFQEARPSSIPPAESQGDPHIVYNAEKNELRFINGCVGAQAVMNLHLHLYNSGLVPCEADAAIITTNNPAVFYVTPEKFTIMSHSELTVSLAFRPVQIGVFQEMLEVRVELPSPLEPQIFQAQLIGEAFLPRITVTSPPFPHKLVFPPTLVGDSSEETIAFVNNGNINCMVIVDILTKNNSLVSFYPENNKSTQIKGSLHQVPLKRGEEHRIVARFSPTGTGEVADQVKLMVTNNPYEDQTIALEGIGYMRDVVVEGLPLVKDQSISAEREQEMHQPSVKYGLSLPPCSVGEFAKKVFALKNQTQETWYRFQWDDVEFVTISPSLGHLPPDSSKELLVVFQSHQPKVVIENKEVGCSLSKIRLINYDSALGWDNHQKTIKWVESTDVPESAGSARRAVCSRPEPEYEELPGSGLSLAVVLSAFADFPQISCPAENIFFPPTIINQKEEHVLLLENTGMVPTQFSWIIHNQIQGQVEESAKACYGSVTMSSERPVLQQRSVRKQKLSVRPATCPRVRPGPIPASVVTLSQDDFFVRESLSNNIQYYSGWPISIEPPQGSIAPGENTTCTVSFKPLELENYSCDLILRLEDAEPDTQTVEMKVEGSSILPCCHLVVPDCSPTSDPQLLQIKFKSMGIKRPVNKCIKVLNTTYDDYTFHWREINQDQLSVFGCSKPVGRVSPTKHIEVVFSFTPRATAHYSSMWQLSIPERRIQQNVLLVGEAFQPQVNLVSTFLKLRPTLIGVCSEGKAVLVNHEDCELKFIVDDNSLHCGNWGQTVQVQPMRGVIPAQAQIDLRVSLCPTQAGQGQFVVQVAVQKLEAPLKLDIVAQCYLVQPQLMYQDFHKIVHNMQSDKDNCIDIGVVEVRIPVTLTFSLTNIGKPVFHYNCVWSSEEVLKNLLSVSVANKTGLVGPQSRQLINFVITPLARTVFSRVRLELVITKGPRFVMFFNGTAAQAHFKFSMKNYDFGACFVLTSDVDFYQTDLVFTNTDEKPLLIEGEFDPKLHLKIGLTQSIVEPRSELHIPIQFLPLACCTYEETLSFLVDGSYRHEVTVTGRGVDLNVMLVNPVDKLVDLEGVVVGRTKQREVEVVNNSEATVTASFMLEPSVPQIRLSPDNPVTLRPRQATKLGVTFTPNTVVKGIEQALVFTFQSVRKVLSVVKASSVGVSVKLDRDYLPFGSIVIGNAPTSKLLLSNDGDLAVKFSWNVDDPVFTISPCEGYIAPSTDVVLKVTYAPLKLQPIVHSRGVCTLSNGEQLSVTLSGRCVELPPPSMTIPLSCPVRSTVSTHIPVFNKFGLEMKLTASISGEYFSGDYITLLPPYGTHLFEILYSPLAMTSPAQPHKGTAIFYFMDGTCLVYSLEGSATEPSMSDKLVNQLVTHTPHTAVVPVQNWLQTPQKFRVTHELLSSTLSVPGYHLTCNEYFMVSGSQTRDLTMTIICHFPGSLTFKVVLTNETSGDYKWYEVIFEVSPCPPLEEVTFETYVRQETFNNLMFHNPLDRPVSVDCKANVLGLTSLNTPLLVQPLHQEEVKLRYLPLWPCDSSTFPLELTCSELGTFPYTVTASALPALPSTPLHIRCDLGQSTSKQLTLTNPAGLQATFQCSSSDQDVSVEPQVVLGPNESTTVQVSFQPSLLCDVTCEIAVTSPEAGDFIFPVIAVCRYPEPRGPFTFTPGSSTTVPFKNVYKGKTTFILSIDNPAFAVKQNNITLQPNQVTDIKVEMLQIEAKEFPKYPVTGKLSVFAEDESLAHIKWAFYLHGELDQS